MSVEIPSTHQKALSINLNAKIYGTIAEIGAAQEVARWFFRVGAAAGSVAKTMSAYDMQVSDDIYGQAGRYVSRERLDSMLNKEYALLVNRLKEKRGHDTRFWVCLAREFDTGWSAAGRDTFTESSLIAVLLCGTGQRGISRASMGLVVRKNSIGTIKH